MAITTAIGLVAAVCTTISYVPQVMKAWRTRSTKDVSAGMFVLLVVGVVLWLTYGLILEDLPLILANFITLCLAAVILLLKLRFG